MNNQLNIYFREKIKSLNEPSKFFEIQYLVGLINSIILMISGLIFFVIYELNIISIFILPVATLIFNLNNHIAVKLAVNRGFIEKAS